MTIRVRRRTARTRRGLTESERLDLLTGAPSAFRSPADRHAAWNVNRVELLRMCPRGEVPAAFWQYDGPPELRIPPRIPLTVLTDDAAAERAIEAGEAFRAARRTYLSTTKP